MLKKVLIANAISCLGFGLLFAVYASTVADFLGSPPTLIIAILGVGLFLNGLNILWVARKQAPSKFEVLQFVVGDGIWVIGTLILLILGLWITTSAGQIWSIAVAIWVGFCGYMQFRYLPT